MAIKRYDIVAVTGTYTDRNGNERRRFLNCGAVFENDKGLSMKLESLPVGGDGWFYLFEPRASETRAPSVDKTEVETEASGLSFDEPPPF